jgi:acetoin utilization protein AcuB
VFVKDQMTPDPITVAPDIPIIEAQQKMQRHNIRHLPVVDQGNHVVGLLTRETMLQAVPWSQSALSTLETQYILSKIKAGKVMIQDVITITEDVAVEEAARIMVDKKIGCLPVVRNEALIGIITDIDLLATTMEMLGARRPGLRLSVLVPYRPGEIARLTSAIAGINGNVTAFGTWEGALDPISGVPQKMGIVARVGGIAKEQLVATVEKLAEIEILDVREMENREMQHA